MILGPYQWVTFGSVFCYFIDSYLHSFLHYTAIAAQQFPSGEKAILTYFGLDKA